MKPLLAFGNKSNKNNDNPATINKYRNIIAFFLIFILLNMTIGCYYYKVTLNTQIKDKELNTLKNTNRFIILHHNSQVWNLTSISFKGDTLYGKVSAFKGHEKYKTTDITRSNKYKNPQEKYILQEVHLYVNENINLDTENVFFPLKAVNKIEIYDQDKAATIASWVFGGIGITALTAGILFIIVLLTKQSCPFIYSYDGEKFNFCGEIYSGAIHPPIERDDYLRLVSLKETEGKFKIKITNEVHEIQNTNLAELYVYDHPENTEILVDKYGNYHTLQNIETPTTSVNLKGNNTLDVIKNKDTLSYISDKTIKDNALTDGLILTFDNPGNKDSAKLIIRGKNTYWLDYVFGKFYELFGIAYNSWLEKQKKASYKELNDWGLSQNIPLSVYVERDGKWVFKDYFNVIGPMAYKDDVLKIDLNGIKKGTFRVKLEYGFYFWDIDKVGIDYDENFEVKKQIAPIYKAITNNGEDISALLSKSDSLYYVQPNVGDEAIIEYNAPLVSSGRRTVFLHSRGHYQIIKSPSGIPDKAYLESFKLPGQFNKYANELLNASLNTEKE